MILFYKLKDPYGCFGNFSRHPVNMGTGLGVFPTAEAAFQAMKFHPHRPDLVDLIRQASTPRIAAEAGRNRAYPMRTDWEEAPRALFSSLMFPNIQPDDGVVRTSPPEPLFARMKDVVMYEVVLAKFRQNEEPLKTLLGSGDDGIVEDSPVDSYWGWGPSRTGENKLGRILMAVRAVLREELAAS